MTATELLQLPISEIRPNPRQPRRTFAEEGLEELALSIRTHGILQPLTVRRTEQGWELIAGERRLRAALLAGLETVPCMEAEADGNRSALLALVENLQRRDLHYFEEAAAIAGYLRASGVTQEEAAAQLGRSPSALANKLRLLRLSPVCRKRLTEHNLTERHARALLRLNGPAQKLMAIETMVKLAMTAQRAESYIESLLEAEKPAKKPNLGRFLAGLDHSLATFRQSGVCAVSERRETDSQIVVTITIPKPK